MSLRSKLLPVKGVSVAMELGSGSNLKSEMQTLQRRQALVVEADAQTAVGVKKPQELLVGKWGTMMRLLQFRWRETLFALGLFDQWPLIVKQPSGAGVVYAKRACSLPLIMQRNDDFKECSSC